MANKRESSASDITTDVYQGSFSEICDHAEMQRAEYVCLTQRDSQVSLIYIFIFCTSISLTELYILISI